MSSPDSPDLEVVLRTFSTHSVADFTTWVSQACDSLRCKSSSVQWKVPGGSLEGTLGTLSPQAAREESGTISLRDLTLTGTIVRTLLDCTVLPRCITAAPVACLLPEASLNARSRGPAQDSLREAWVLSLQLDAGVLLKAVEAAASVILSPDQDARLCDMALPKLFAGLFACQRSQSDLSDRHASSELIQLISSSLPVRTVCGSLLSLLWGQWLKNYHAEPLRREGSALGPDGGVAATAAASVGLHSWLRSAAAAELARLLCSRLHAVEGCLDAVFDAVDCNNPLAADRVIQLAATVLCRPPLELAGASSYYAGVGPQLLQLLGIRGHRANLLGKAAAVVVAQSLALPPPLWRPVLQHVLLPLLEPLLCYSKGRRIDNDGSLPSSEETEGEIELASEDDIGSCVERLHRLLCGDAVMLGTSLGAPASDELSGVHASNPHSAGDALASVTSAPTAVLGGRALHVFASALPALFDLLCAARATRLRAGFAQACEDIVVAVLGAVPPPDARQIVLQLFRLHKCANSEPAHSAADAQQLPGRALLVSRLLPRHACCRFALGASAGFRVLLRVGPGRVAGATFADEEAALGLSSSSVPALAMTRQTRSNTSRVPNQAPRLADLLNIVGSAPAAGGPSLNSVSAGASLTRDGYSQGLDAGAGLTDPIATLGALRANVCVDVLRRLRRPTSSGRQSGEPPNNYDGPVAAVFSTLLSYYCRARLGSRPEKAQPRPKGTNSPRRLITVLGGEDDVGGVSPSERGSESAAESSPVLDCCDSAGDAAHDVRALQLLVCLCERLGPSLLRSSLQALQCVRSVLHMCVIAAALPIPSPSSVGAGQPGSIAHRLCVDAAAALPPLRPADESLPSAPSFSHEELVSLISLSLGLLTGVVGLPSPLDDEAGGDACIGSADDEEDQAGVPGSHLDPETRAWVRSLLPLLAALAAADSPIDDGGTVIDPDLAAALAEKGVPEMADTLRAIILVLPEADRPPAVASTSDGLESSRVPVPSLCARRERVLRAFRQALGLTLDPTPALQALGLRNFALLLGQSRLEDWSQESETEEVARATANDALPEEQAPPLIAAVYGILIKGLSSIDSFVFLAAIEALRALTARAPAIALTWLLRDYEAGQPMHVHEAGPLDSEGRYVAGRKVLDVMHPPGVKSMPDDAASSSAPATAAASDTRLDIRTRVKVGEALYAALRVCHRLHIAAAVPTLAEVALAKLQGRAVAVLLRLGPQGWRDTRPLEDALLADRAPTRPADLGRAINTDAGFPGQETTRLNSEGAIDHAYNIALALADAVDLRCSSLSLLGSVASLSSGQTGGWFGGQAVDVVTGLIGVLQFERNPRRSATQEGPSDAEAAERVAVAAGFRSKVRTAAAHALACICEGRGLASFRRPSQDAANAATVALLHPLVSGGHLRDVRTVLSTTAMDPTEDALTRQHASDALDGINAAVPILLGQVLGHGAKDLHGVSVAGAGTSSDIASHLLTVVSSKRLLPAPSSSAPVTGARMLDRLLSIGSVH